MSELETAMGMLIDVFDRYASTDSNKETLTKGELKTLMEKEFPNFVKPMAPEKALFLALWSEVLSKCKFQHQQRFVKAAYQNGKDNEAVDKLFENLDNNGDSQVDFNEFVVFVAALTSACHKYCHQKGPK